MDLEKVKKGVVKRKTKREVGIFIDGLNLDRASRRLGKRVDLAKLVQGLSSGLKPTIARYYTIVPHEDDSRHRAFLDAVAAAGLEVIVKRLPPKGNDKQVTINIEMAADIIAFSLGASKLEIIENFVPQEENAVTSAINRGLIPNRISTKEPAKPPRREEARTHLLSPDTNKVVTLVCAGNDLTYPIKLSKFLGADTVSADFGKTKKGNVLNGASKWIDLSDSETIFIEES